MTNRCLMGKEVAAASPNTLRLGRLEWGGLAVIAVLALVVRLVGAGGFHGYAYDEAYYVATAQNLLGLKMLHGTALTAPVARFTDPNLFSAPPFGKELIAASIRLFGNHPWAWRFPGGILGASLPLAGFFLARFWFPRPRLVAWTAALFLALEGLGIGMSRVGILDSTVVPLAMWGILLATVYGHDLVAVDRVVARMPGLLAGGVFLGLALATKWTGAQALVTTGGILVLGFASAVRTVAGPRTLRIIRAALLYFLALVVVPLAVYVATYLWGAGPIGFENGVPASAGYFGGILYIQHRLLDGMWALQFSHPWLAPAWTWFLLPRPIYLISQNTGTWHSSVYALANPWWVWMGAVGLVAGLVKLIRPALMSFWPGSRIAWAGLWIWTLAFYGTWFLSPRSKFDYYFYPMTVAVAIAAGAVAPGLRRWLGDRATWPLRVYWGVLLLSTLYLVPIWVGVSLPSTWSNDLVWVPTWGPIQTSTSSSTTSQAPSTVVRLSPLAGTPVPSSASALPAVVSAYGYGTAHDARFSASWAPLNLGLPAGGPVAGQVAVTADGSVYAGTTNGQVVAIGALSGLRTWTATVPNQVSTLPLVVPDGTRTLVIVGIGNGQFRSYNSSLGWIRGSGKNGIVALDAASGRRVWMTPTLGEDMATPVYHAGVLYEVTGSGRFLALDAATGHRLWSLQLTGFDSLSSLEWVNGHVLVATNQYLQSYPAHSSILWSIDVATHHVAWATHLPAKSGLSDCTVAVFGNTAYLGGVKRIANTSPLPTLTEQLYAVNVVTGRIRWIRGIGSGHLPLNQEEVGVPLATASAIYVANPASGQIWAWSPTGRILWTTKLPGSSATGAPALAGGRLFWGTSTGSVAVVNTDNGALDTVDTLTTGPIGPSSPVFVGDTLWFGTLTGYVDALGVGR